MPLEAEAEARVFALSAKEQRKKCIEKLGISVGSFVRFQGKSYHRLIPDHLRPVYNVIEISSKYMLRCCKGKNRNKYLISPLHVELVNI